MKKTLLTLAATTAMMACSPSANQEQSATKEAFKLDTTLTAEQKTARVFTTEVMWKMGRMGSLILSPDGSTALYSLTRYNLEQNRSSTTLWVQPFKGGEPVQLTSWGYSDNSPQWSVDGKKIYFMSSREGGSQLWVMDANGENMTKISDVQGGIGGFGVSSGEDKVWYAAEVQVEAVETKDIYKDAPQSKALVYDDLMARHWDVWEEGSYSHVFVADLNGGKLSNAVDINEGEPWDVPTAPYYDASEILWNNSGTALAYTARKLTGYEYAISTNTDIYLYTVADKSTKNLTEGMPGYDKYPTFSPDDKMIAWQSMERAGNESDRDRLFVMNAADGSSKMELTTGFDYPASNLVWSADAQKITFIAPMAATYQICEANVAKAGDIKILTAGDHDYTAFTRVGDNIAAKRTTLSSDNEWFAVSSTNGEGVQRSFINKTIYDNVDMGNIQKRWVTTTDNKQMLTWVILPPNFDETKSYPTLLYCQGGPQSVVSQRWSYRWNFQLMASQGYIIVAPNRRGLPSFGQEWLDQISGDYSGQNIRDYLSAIDDVSKESWADQDRMGCIGASYGGYSVFYLAGHHQERFKAFISHCGIFDFTSMYGSTEELWFVNRDYGGAYWEKDNAVAQRSYANSPHHFVDKWDTPIMIITGLKDFRIPYTQSLEAFTAAKAHGIDSRLVAFEDEAHQVFKPQNNLVWNKEFFGWLDKYLKK